MTLFNIKFIAYVLVYGTNITNSINRYFKVNRCMISIHFKLHRNFHKFAGNTLFNIDFINY